MAKGTHIRITPQTKERLVTIQRRLTVEAGGVPVTMDQTLNRILDEWSREDRVKALWSGGQNDI